jgi:fructose-1,6-bisphosphatase/inositol monophosphatase family enzyme
VTGADLQVQEFILSRLAETPLVECELFAEEATPSVYKFKGTNGLVFLIDPIDGTAKYVSGGKFFSVIISMHNKKDLLYTYYRFPLLGWTKRIVKNKAEDIGNVPKIEIKQGVDAMGMIAYLEYIKPDKLPPEVEDMLKIRGL